MRLSLIALYKYPYLLTYLLTNCSQLSKLNWIDFMPPPCVKSVHKTLMCSFDLEGKVERKRMGKEESWFG